MENKSNKIVWGIVGTVILLIVLMAVFPFTIVKAGQRAIVTNFGKVNRVLPEGIHWVTPITEDVIKLDVRIQKEQVDSSASSKDLQSVAAVIAINYSIDPEKVGNLYTEIGTDYKTKKIDPAVQEAVKAATAKYTAEELVTKRALVRDDIVASLKEQLAPSYINVQDVSIVNFDFSPSFNAAIETKVTAEQNALAAKNNLEKVKFEQQAQIEIAKAQAEAIKLQSEAANNEKYVSLKRVEVELERAKRWNGASCTSNCYGEVSAAPFPFLNITK